MELEDYTEFAVIDEISEIEEELAHYGTKRHSGRYPWGSGENPFQRSGDFLSRVQELKKQGPGRPKGSKNRPGQQASKPKETDSLTSGKESENPTRAKNIQETE